MFNLKSNTKGRYKIANCNHYSVLKDHLRFLVRVILVFKNSNGNVVVEVTIILSSRLGLIERCNAVTDNRASSIHMKFNKSFYIAGIEMVASSIVLLMLEQGLIIT